MRRLLGRLVLLSRPAWRALRLLGRRRPLEPVDHPDRRPRVLVVSPIPVHPVIHGAAVRISNLIRRMSDWCDVSLLVLGEATDDPEHRQGYEAWCEHVLFHRLDDCPEPTRDSWGLLPPAARRFDQPALSDRIAALVDAHDIDIVMLEFAELGGQIEGIDGARTVLVEHDLGFATQRRQRGLGMAGRFDAAGRIGAGWLDGRRQERFELAACAAADQVHCMSAHDRDVLAARLGSDASIEVVPNGVDTRCFEMGSAEGRTGLLFVGSFPHLPNRDAFEHLVDDIWPEIRRRRPGATLTVAGARPPDAVLRHDGRDGISVVGEVDDLAPLYRAHRALVVPLRAGSGTRLKILEALASGLPVVSTTIGAEGLAVSDPPVITVVDGADAVADAAIRWLDADDATLGDRARRGRDLVESCYDWDAIAGHLRGCLEELLDGGRPAPVLRATASDPPASGAGPWISVIVPTAPGSPPGAELLDGLDAQELDRPLETVVVDLGSPSPVVAGWRERGIRVVSVDGPSVNRGAALNAGAAAAAGRILVFVSPDAIPADPHWLARLTAPFDDDRAPAAVQGGITIQLEDGGVPHDLAFTRESERWRAAHGGFAFSTDNAAVPRAVWRRFPLPPVPRLAGHAWQRLVTQHGLLILPCHAAAVRRVTPLDPGSYRRACIDEGRAWRRIGERYTIGDLRADLRSVAIDAEGSPVPPGRPEDRELYRARALGLLIGNRLEWLGRRLSRDRYTSGR